MSSPSPSNLPLILLLCCHCRNYCSKAMLRVSVGSMSEAEKKKKQNKTPKHSRLPNQVTEIQGQLLRGLPQLDFRDFSLLPTPMVLNHPISSNLSHNFISGEAGIYCYLPWTNGDWGHKHKDISSKSNISLELEEGIELIAPESQLFIQTIRPSFLYLPLRIQGKCYRYLILEQDETVWQHTLLSSCSLPKLISSNRVQYQARHFWKQRSLSGVCVLLRVTPYVPATLTYRAHYISPPSAAGGSVLRRSAWKSVWPQGASKF